MRVWPKGFSRRTGQAGSRFPIIGGATVTNNGEAVLLINRLHLDPGVVSNAQVQFNVGGVTLLDYLVGAGAVNRDFPIFLLLPPLYTIEAANIADPNAGNSYSGGGEVVL